MEHDWKPTETQPEGAVCMTKIDDRDGCRNEAALRRLAVSGVRQAAGPPLVPLVRVIRTAFGR